MYTMMQVLIVVAVVWTLFYFRAPAIVWLLASASALFAWHSFLSGYLILKIISWILLLTFFLPLIFRPLRRVLISNRLLAMFKPHVPALSRSEQEALEAGTVWWDGDLFGGRPDWNKLLSTSYTRLSDKERDFIDGPVETLCEMLNDWEITQRDYDLPEEVWRFLREYRFFGMIIPQQYGGLGFSALAHSTVVMKIATRSITAAVTVMVPNSLGPAELLMQYGTDEQKDYYLPRLAKGVEIPCFALTGPNAGSDASSIPDKGVICHGSVDGQQHVPGIRLNWNKRYITLGPVATVIGLAFHLYDPDHILGDREDLGITVALIPADTPGITIGRRHFPLNIPFQNGPNQGKNVFIPLDRVIGGKAMLGQGWRMLMECLAAGRSISLPALSTGAGKLASFATGAYSRIRNQFHLPIGKFEGVEEALTRIAVNTYQMDAVRKLTASAVDHDEKPAVLSAIAKYHLTEKMRRLINDAMDIQAGSAICMGPRNFLARVYQAIPISITVEGANILTRSMIIFGQGAMRCHPFILREIQSVFNPDQRAARISFDQAIFGHVNFLASNIARALFTGLSRGRLVYCPVQDDTRYFYRQLSRMSTAFALLADMSILVLGASLKRREKLSARLADILSELYIASATLKQYVEQGSQSDEYPIVVHACRESLYSIQESIFSLLENFPNRTLAFVLRRLIFPLGSEYQKPQDELGHEVASLIQEPCPVRFRLCRDLFVPKNEEDSVRALEIALSRVLAAEPIEKVLHEHIHHGSLDRHPDENLLERAVLNRVISQEQANTVRIAQQAREKVIQVDDFPNDLSLMFEKNYCPVNNRERTG